MQPEVKEKIQAINEVIKPKKEFTPIEQWDQLAFSVVFNELAPKGFKTQKNGKYRGSEYVEVSKKAVIKTQKIGAQLVRGFREKAKKELQKSIESSKPVKWWNIKARWQRGERIRTLEDIIKQIDNVNIK